MTHNHSIVYLNSSKLIRLLITWIKLKIELSTKAIRPIKLIRISRTSEINKINNLVLKITTIHLFNKIMDKRQISSIIMETTLTMYFKRILRFLLRWIHKQGHKCLHSIPLNSYFSCQFKWELKLSNLDKGN